MISAFINTEGEILSLRLEGHAGYAEIGSDIVCSSASILAYTVASMVEEEFSKNRIKSAPIIRLEPGYVFISCEPTVDARKSFEFAKRGYELLEQNFPKYVRLLP